MADTNQDKTEQATSKRQSEARDSGQVAYSKELTAAILFLAGIATLKWVGGDIATALFAAMRRMLMLPVHLLNETSPGPFLATIGREILTWLWPVFAIGMISTLGPGMAQTKLAMSFKKLKPDLSKLDPIKGVKKLFSLDSVINVMASALKMFLVGYLVWYTIDAALPRMMTLTSQGLGEMIDLLLELIFLLGFRVGAGLATIGFLDVLYRQWKNGKDLMMTKEEVKEERKSAEGDPKIKSKIRSIQRAMALQRMKT
ncbi:MAG: EscU/YscU/HrcU family type III secretion system export apparatus switch protein, partial [Planctomycetes bacterium]|nr:EscU/YscU/HrcU family type III secretion system export apparatus switch protein [Planctomycetota bacterium]